MKFADLVTELRGDIWPEGVPESLAAPINKNFEAAVTHLQRYIPCLQTRNINRYPQCSTYFQGGKTVIDAPKGRINKVYTILDQAGEEVYPALFKQVTKDELDCNSLKLLSLVYPPKNLSSESLPMGFKYPEADSDYKVDGDGDKKATKHGRAVIGQWAVDKGRIYISPWINSDEVVVVEWDGVKTRYNSEDAVIEDIDFKRAVKLFVQREVARDFDNDYERYKYMTLDFDMAMGDLIHECKKQTEVKQTFYCPEAYDILAYRRNKKFNEVADAASAVADAQAAITSYTFAVIGDYGASLASSGDYDGTNASAVATLVKGWNPDFILTVGDNSYSSTGGDSSGASPITRYAKYDDNIGQWYSDYIFPYGHSDWGAYTSSATENKFFPAIGNHDITEDYGTTNAGLATYKRYFTLLNNEEHYSFTKGQVEFFCLFSNERTGGAVYNSSLGVGITSGQHEWLDSALADSPAHWKVVYFHNAPYTTESGGHSPGDSDMQWDFPGMGADVVISGHAHNYERLKDANDFRYLVCGASGAPLRDTQVSSTNNYGLPTGITTEKFYGTEHGAIRGTADDTTLKFEFINKSGTVVDTYTMTKALSDTTTTRTATA